MKDNACTTTGLLATLACIELIQDIKFPSWFRTMILSAQSPEEAAAKVICEVDGRLERGGNLPEWLIGAFDCCGFEDTQGKDPLTDPRAFVLSLQIWKRRANSLGIIDQFDPIYIRLIELRDKRLGHKELIDQWATVVNRTLAAK